MGTVHVVIDVVGYFDRPKCRGGAYGWNGSCYEIGTRTAASVFEAGSTCAANGGRLARVLELRSMGHCPDGLMTVADNGAVAKVANNTAMPYRCVYDN